MTTTPSHAEWEPLLLGHNYRLIWFDGVNRFYLAEERAELAPHFATPPNAHDGMPRFATLGSALQNRQHPDHGFALHLASLLLKAPGVETDEYLEQVMRKDRPPALFDNPVNEAAVTELYRLVHARLPDPSALDHILSRTPPPTGATLIRKMLRSDEFRMRRSRIAMG
jgi:hypothetical protein